MDEFDAFLDGPAQPQATAATDDLDAFLDGPSAPQAQAAQPIFERGGTFDRLANAVPDSVTESMPFRALAGVGAGLTKRATGIIQAGADLVGATGTAEAAGGVKRKIEADTARMGTTGKIGEFVGDVAPFVALPAGGASLASRVALGAAGGAAEGATRANDEAGLAQRGKDAAVGAVIGAAVPAALTGAGKVIKGTIEGGKAAARGIRARGIEELGQAASDLKAAANASYKASREAGAVIAKPRGISIANKVGAAIADSGKLNARLHGDTLSVLDDFKTAAKSGGLSLEELDQFRQLFSEVASKNTSKIDGANADAFKATQAIRAIDDAVNGLGKTDIVGGKTKAVELLQQARKQWAQFSKFETVNRIVQNADGDANRLKAGLAKLANDSKRLRGFSPDERKALQAAAKNTTGELLLKTLGKFGVDLGGSITPGNTALPAIGAFTAGATSGASTGGALLVAGTAARFLQKLVGRGKVENVLRVIEQGGAELPQRLIQETGSAMKARQAATVLMNQAQSPEARAQMKGVLDQLRDAAKAGKQPLTKAGQNTSQSGSAGSGVVKAGAVLGTGLAGADLASSLITGNRARREETAQAELQRASGMAGALDAQERAQPSVSRAMAVDSMAREQPDELGNLIRDMEANPVQAGRLTPSVVDKIIGVESGGRADAKNTKSSATGLGQFISSTWLAMVDRHAPELAVGKSKADILRLRKNPEVSRFITKKYAEDNVAILNRAGVPVSDSTVYLAHFLGPQTAAKILKADPRKPVRAIVGKDAVNANPSVLRGKNVAQLIAWADKKMRK